MRLRGIDSIVNEHLHEGDRKLVDRAVLRYELKAVIDSCQGGDVAECRLIEALGPSLDGRELPKAPR